MHADGQTCLGRTGRVYGAAAAASYTLTFLTGKWATRTHTSKKRDKVPRTQSHMQVAGPAPGGSPAAF